MPDGKQLKFLSLPDGHDPDTYTKTHGKSAMAAAIAQALSTADYIFATLTQNYDLSRPENKAAAMAKLKELTQKFPKGSSFKWWLNNDIYQKLNDKKLKKTTNKLSYASHIDSQLQLCLCLLYEPKLLQDDPLEHILQSANLYACHQPYADKLALQNITMPKLPTWQTLDDDLLSELVHTIKNLIKQAPAYIDFKINDQSPHTINERAHLLIASLPTQCQSKVAQAWQEFFYQTQQHPLTNLQLLFGELLCQRLQDNFKKQHKDSQNLLTSEIYKRRLQALLVWDNDNKANVANLLEKGSA